MDLISLAKNQYHERRRNMNEERLGLKHWDECNTQEKLERLRISLKSMKNRSPESEPSIMNLPSTYE